MILAKLRTAMLAAIPGLDAPKTAFFRVQRQVIKRLNLQPVAGIADQTKDLSNVEVCPGVPGVTSDPTDGETPIIAFVGADGVPYVIARASESMPGHTPIEVRHDATTAIRIISKAPSAGAKVYVGSATFPVASSPPVTTAFTALQAFALASSTATTAAQIAVAAGALNSALLAIPGYGTTKLEAQ
jgi:hypothetical protein